MGLAIPTRKKICVSFICGENEKMVCDSNQGKIGWLMLCMQFNLLTIVHGHWSSNCVKTLDWWTRILQVDRSYISIVCFRNRQQNHAKNAHVVWLHISM